MSKKLRFYNKAGAHRLQIGASGIIVVLLIVLIIVVYRQQHYCKQTSPYDLPFSSEYYANIADYLAVISKVETVENSPTDTVKTFFCFANNAYNFDEKSTLVIYANNKKVYEGNFCTRVTLSSLSQFENALIHFDVEILCPFKKNKYVLHRFSNKSVVYWGKEYTNIYACFFPTNQNIDQIHFFPAKYEVIQ